MEHWKQCQNHLSRSKSLSPYMRSVKLRYRDWEAEMVPGFGANVIRLKHNSIDILRSPDTMEEALVSPYLYGIPILFPPNRTESGAFTFDGNTYQLQVNETMFNNHLHGLMFDAPFHLVNSSDHHARCVYENNGERYPFKFTMAITILLDEDGFYQQVDIDNVGNTNMPVLIGFHTTFVEPDKFQVPIGKRWVTKTNHIPTGELADLTKEELEYIGGCCPRGRMVSGFFNTAGNKAKIGKYVYTTSNNFTQWVLFNGGGDKGYLCIEPQSGPVNGLNMPDGHIRLAKGERVQFWTRISKGE
jgi:aldose 1-epimerase